jgi:chitinase
VKISYTKPSNNPIQTTSGGVASSLTNQSVTNNCANISPTANIISPVNNSSFTSPADITIDATASDPDGTISMVEFYNGSTKIGSSSEAPYSITWSNVNAGTYSLTAVATDNLNAKTTSSAMSVSVLGDQVSQNESPVIQISNPLKGNIYDQVTSITIAAVASDPDGTISKVEFYNGKVRLVELTSAPYTFTWKDVASGKYTITAIATDNQNATTVSAPVEFVVGSDVKYGTNSDLVNLYPNPNNGQFSIEFATPLQNGKNEITITDLAGKLVYNKAASNSEILKHFELAGLKSGMYVLIIKYMEILITKKFIIK